MDNTELLKSLDLSSLEKLSPAEKKLVFSVLEEFAKEGKSELYDNLLLEDYEEIPVDIEEFVDNNYYLGNAWHDGQGNSKLYPYWRKELRKLFPNNLDTNVNNVILSGSRGRGKALPNSSFVKTNIGLKQVKDIKVGDYLIDRLGNPTKVLGVYPQGEKIVYKITFEDERTALCCSEHLWTWKTKNSNFKTTTLSEIMLNNDDVFIPLNNDDIEKYKKTILKIIKIEKQNYKEEMTCFYVDNSEHLFQLGNGIVTHNTEIAVLIAAYLLHRILCLKNPIEHFHLKSTEKIVFAFMNIKLALAEEIATTKFQNTIKQSPWFLAHGTLEGRTKKVWIPRKYINENGEEQEAIDIKIGSQPDDVIGLPIYYCLSGDTQILTNNGVFKIEDLENKTIKVFNINDSNDAVLSKDCTVKMTAESTEAYKIELEDGTILECTPNHRFMLLDGSYKEAQELTEEDEILEYTPVGYVYKVTNLENGDFYIGQHKKPYFDKNYYGSGVVAKRIYKKYGRDSLKVEILDWAKTLDELNKKEEYYMDKYYLDDYNINISKTAVKGNEHPLDWQKRKHYYTNGIETKVLSDDEVPDGYVLTNHNKDKKAITNGNITRFIDKDETIPSGFYYGNHSSSGEHDMSRYYNNPEAQKKNSESKSGKHNSMYGKGYKVAGEKNGRFGKPASTLAMQKAKETNTKYIYIIDDKKFYGITEIKRYLNSLGYHISDTGIEGLVNKGSRIIKKYPELDIRKEIIKNEN